MQADDFDQFLVGGGEINFVGQRLLSQAIGIRDTGESCKTVKTDDSPHVIQRFKYRTELGSGHEAAASKHTALDYVAMHVQYLLENHVLREKSSNIHSGHIFRKILHLLDI